MNKFQAIMTREIMRGKEIVKIVKVGYVETQKQETAFNILKKLNKRWTLNLGDVLQVEKFDYELEV